MQALAIAPENVNTTLGFEIDDDCTYEYIDDIKLPPFPVPPAVFTTDVMLFPPNVTVFNVLPAVLAFSDITPITYNPALNVPDRLNVYVVNPVLLTVLLKYVIDGDTIVLLTARNA
jgi:hypothetical protein